MSQIIEGHICNVCGFDVPPTGHDSTPCDGRPVKVPNQEEIWGVVSDLFDRLNEPDKEYVCEDVESDPKLFDEYVQYKSFYNRISDLVDYYHVICCKENEPVCSHKK